MHASGKVVGEFTHYLGEDVGGLAANVFEFQTNVGEGFVKAGIESIQSIQQLDPTRFAYDFDGAKATWGALADTAKYADPMYALTHPIGAFEHGKDMVEGLVHAEDWRADRPGLGLGGLGFEAATTVTGVGAAKTATKGGLEAAETAAARAAPELRAASGSAAEVSNIGENVSKVTEKLDKLDDFPTGSALPGSNGPTIPTSLTEPKAPVAPHIPDTPAPRPLRTAICAATTRLRTANAAWIRALSPAAWSLATATAKTTRHSPDRHWRSRRCRQSC